MPLVTDAQVMSHLNKPNMSAGDLEEVQGMIAAAEGIVVGRVGDIEPILVTEMQTGGRDEIALDRDPVMAVTAVKYAASGSTAVVASDVAFDADSGVIWRVSESAFPAARLEVTYTAGRSTVPDEFIEATLIIVKHLWETQRGHGGTRPGLFGEGDGGGGESSASAGFVYRGFAIPNRALQLLAHHTRPAIA